MRTNTNATTGARYDGHNVLRSVVVVMATNMTVDGGDEQWMVHVVSSAWGIGHGAWCDVVSWHLTVTLAMRTADYDAAGDDDDDNDTVTAQSPMPRKSRASST